METINNLRKSLPSPSKKVFTSFKLKCEIYNKTNNKTAIIAQFDFINFNFWGYLILFICSSIQYNFIESMYTFSKDCEGYWQYRDEKKNVASCSHDAYRFLKPFPQASWEVNGSRILEDNLQEVGTHLLLFFFSA